MIVFRLSGGLKKIPKRNNYRPEVEATVIGRYRKGIGT